MPVVILLICLCWAVLCCAMLCRAGTSICGQCVKFRGKGQGLGGNPVSTEWQVRGSCRSLWSPYQEHNSRHS